MSKYVAAVDLGATSGRICIGHVEAEQLQLEEIYRFSHEAQNINGELFWQWDYIVEQVIIGLKKAKERGELSSIGVDFWAVDYGLLDSANKLISTPHCYRDSRTDKYFEKIPKDLTSEYIYSRTGIQFLFFNTLYQLAAEKNEGKLDQATKFLMLPDLLNNILCGSESNEVTNASTTQLLNAQRHEWDWELIEKIGLPKSVFPPLHQPGSVLGKVNGFNELDGIPVVAVGSHDTASAVAGIPLSEDGCSAYISSGTWSLVGLELEGANTTPETFKSNITNELGVENRIRFIKNVAGLWMLEESIRYWRKAGLNLTAKELVEQAGKLKSGGVIVNARDPKYTKSGAIPEWIAQDFKDKGVASPTTPGEFALVIFESLADAYREVIKELEIASGIKVKQLNIVGGGSANELLNQLAANATGLKVISGPMEATALGNLIVQLIALKEVKDLSAGRRLIANSIKQKVFVPNV